MILAVVIGLLTAMVIVAPEYTHERSIATRVANELYVFAEAFQIYTLENGAYPSDVGSGKVPSGMKYYLKTCMFTSEAPVGGRYDWYEDVFGVTAREPTIWSLVGLSPELLILWKQLGQLTTKCQFSDEVR